jgi:hypothetical protein
MRSPDPFSFASLNSVLSANERGYPSAQLGISIGWPDPYGFNTPEARARRICYAGRVSGEVGASLAKPNRSGTWNVLAKVGDQAESSRG